jgi:hypothetical protein
MRRKIAHRASALRRGVRQSAQRRRNLFFEPLENRNLLSATAFEHDGIGYFLDVTNRELDRYDIANEEWLASTPLAGAASPPTYALVDDDGIYVAYNTSVYRYQLDGTTPVHLLNATSTVQALHTDGNILFVNHTSGYYARVLSINKSTNTVVDTIDNYIDSVHGSSIAPQANRIFGRTAGISPSDITYVSYNDNGTFTGGGGSPYHGDYPGGPPTWTFPDGGKVVDSSGTVYSTNSLTRLNSLGTHIDEIDFAGGTVPIVRNGTVLTAYTVGLLPTGSYDLRDVPRELLVSNEKIFVVYDDGAAASGYRVDVVSLSALNAPEPGAPIDPNGLTYTPDQVMRASDGNILVFSKAHQSVFRWDPIRQEFGTTIPLIGAPDYMTYSSETNTVYLAYQTGLIRKIDLNLDIPVEVPFATLATSPLGLAAAGKYLFAADGSGAWMSHYTFAPDGTQLSVKDWNYYSREYIWSEVQQKMYFFRDDTSPNDLLSEVITEGVLSGYTDSPLHDSYGFTHPIRVSPDGSTVVLGSGKIHDATTLARKTQALSVSVSDIAWLGNRMFTVRNITGVSQVQEWLGSTYAPGHVQQFPNTAHSLTAIGTDKLLLISMDGGTPAFTLLDANLNVIAKPTPVANAGTDQRVPIGVPAQLDGSASFDPDNSPNPLTFTWSIVSGPGEGVFGDSSQAVTNFTGQSAGDYVLRLTVSDGTYTSSDTMNVNVRTNTVPVADASLSATHAVANRIAAILDGSRSFDNDGDLLQYEWTILSKPTGSNPTIANSQQKIASFTADIPGDYTVTLTVSDGYLTNEDNVTITVTPNLAPTADATLSGLTGVAGRTSVSLDASLSSDPDADALTYSWTVTSGPAEAITSIVGNSQQYASFSANLPGDYTVQVTVSDGELMDTDFVRITLGENQAPLADASASTTFVLEGGSYPTLDGRGSSDPDGDALSYQWSFISSTNGMKPTISKSSTSLATLNTNTAGVYAVALVVSDGLKSDTNYVLITVRGNQPPTADASLTNTVGLAGLPVSLNGSLSRDADGDPLTYQWEILTSTNTSPLPVAANPQSAISSFVAPSAGTYLTRLTVSDGVAQSTDFCLITIQANPNPPMLGDFDQDGDVDGRDFLHWQRGVGTVDAGITDGDCNGDAKVDGVDLAVWQQSYAQLPQINGDFDRDGDTDGRDLLEWQRGRSPKPIGSSDLATWQASFTNEPGSSLSTMFVAEVMVDNPENSDAPKALPSLGVVSSMLVSPSKSADEVVERVSPQIAIVDDALELLYEPARWRPAVAGDIAVNREGRWHIDSYSELDDLILTALAE